MAILPSRNRQSNGNRYGNQICSQKYTRFTVLVLYCVCIYNVM